MKKLLATLLSATLLPAADLPVTRVILYKNGVACYERAGEVKPAEPARLDFKAAEMDDVLKSLSVAGPAIARVRYDMSETLQRRLADVPFTLAPGAALATLLDQLRGARIELTFVAGPVSGTIVSARLSPLANQGQRQELTLLTDGGALRVIDLDTATSLKLAEARLQSQLSDALATLAQARSKDRRALYLDATQAGRLTARYLVPAPVWKSSYRLSLGEGGESTLEGWAIVDNASGEDWSKVDLTLVSGKPVSFISRLYEPKYVTRAEAALADDQPAAPVTYDAAMSRADAPAAYAMAPAPPAPAMARNLAGAVGGMRKEKSMMLAEAAPQMMVSSAAVQTVAREAGDLFEYRFSNPVNARKGESLLLPFLQQALPVRKLLIYSDSGQLNPRHAAEITNNSGKTLDGGPLTVYSAAGYNGEALMDTLKSGDKRLISYSVDQGVRVTTRFDSGQSVIRSLRAAHGVLTTRSSVESITTYTIDNVEPKAKSLLIEHAVDPNQKLLSPKAEETSATKYRFAVALPAKGPAKLVVTQERLLEETISASDLGPDQLVAYLSRKDISAAARAQFQALAAKRAQLTSVENELNSIEAQLNEAAKDQSRLRENINTLNRVAGQQEQVNRYAQELARLDTSLAKLRDRQAELRKAQTALEAELTGLFEKLEF